MRCISRPRRARVESLSRRGVPLLALLVTGVAAASGGTAAATSPAPLVRVSPDVTASSHNRLVFSYSIPRRKALVGHQLAIDLELRAADGRWGRVSARPAPAPGSGKHQLALAARVVERWPATVRLRLRVRGSQRVLATTAAVRVSRPATVPRPTPAPGPSSSPVPAAATPTPTPTASPSPSPAPGVQASGTLPLLEITTDGAAAITSREDYVGADLALSGVSARTEIRGRGNSTWWMPKKPYRLKLAKKASLLGMPSSRHWVLLADYADPSLLRNELALALGRATRLAWTPRQQAVELVLNGSYAGVYHLTEQIRADADRVNIAVAAPGAEPSTGGYLLERDSNYGEEPSIDCSAEGLGSRPPGFITPASGTGGQTPVLVHEPECHTEAQLAYISGHVGDFERTLYGSGFKDPVTGYRPYVDVDSFVDWVLVQEFTKNIDAWSKSVWFYKPAGGQLTMGPLWDFDLSLQSPYPVQAGWVPAVESPVGPGVSLYGTGWLARMLSDPWFETTVVARWAQLRGDVLALRAQLRSRAAELTAAAAADGVRWPRPTSFADEVEVIDAWIVARVSWLDERFG